MRDKPVIGLILTTAIFLSFLSRPSLAGDRYAAGPDAMGGPLFPAVSVIRPSRPEIDSVQHTHLLSTPDGDLLIAASTPGKKGDSDIIVARVDPDDGTVFNWMILGGSGNEWVGGLALDAKGRVLITGGSDSADFPLAGGGLITPTPPAAPRRTFLCRISADLKTLEQSALPVSGDGLALATGGDGSIYLAGRTKNETFTEKKPGMNQSAPPGPNGFIIKVSPETWQVTNQTMLGGSQLDWVKALAVNSAGDIVAAGDTNSSDFPFSESSWQPRLKGNNGGGFVAVITPDLKKIKAASAVGFSMTEVVNTLLIGRNDSIIVSGWTTSSTFPSTRGDKYHGGGDCFVISLSADLKKLENARLFGGVAMDSGRALTGEAGTFIVLAMESESPLIKGIKQPLENTGEKDIDLLFLGPSLKILRPAYAGTDLPDHNPALALGEGNRVILLGVAEEGQKARIFLSEHNLY